MFVQSYCPPIPTSTIATSTWKYHQMRQNTITGPLDTREELWGGGASRNAVRLSARGSARCGGSVGLPCRGGGFWSVVCGSASCSAIGRGPWTDHLKDESNSNSLSRVKTERSPVPSGKHRTPWESGTWSMMAWNPRDCAENAWKRN